MVRLKLSVAALAAVACVFSAAASAQTGKQAFTVTEIAKFSEPWAMTFLPDGRLLVTEKKGALKVHAIGGKTGNVTGVPTVAYGGQGGFGDVVLHPKFATNGQVYVSYAEPGEGSTRGGAVARAKLTLDSSGGGALSDLKVIWRQVPKVDGQGHYGHRMAFGPAATSGSPRANARSSTLPRI